MIFFLMYSARILPYESKFLGICSDRYLCGFLIEIDSPLLSL